MAGKASIRDSRPAGPAVATAEPPVLEYNFRDSVGHWICRTAHLFERAMNDELTPQGITWRQCQVLAWLAFEGDLSQVALAERLRVEPPTLVRILDRMERDGLIARVDCSDDRRCKRISVRPKARTMWDTIVECATRVRARATRGLSREELAELQSLLERIRSNLDENESGDTPQVEPRTSSTKAPLDPVTRR